MADTGRVGELRHGVLGIADAVAESIALLALVLASSFATSLVAGNAGPAAPLAYVVAGIGSLLLASVIIRFTRRMASAGGVYTYIARGLHPNAGFIAGWLYAWGFAAGISFVIVISAVYLSTVLSTHTALHLSWIPAFLILMVILAVLAFLDIRISTRTQLVVAAAGIAAVLILLFIILAKGGNSGISLQPFNPGRLPGLHGLFLATVFAFTGFIGFEAAAVLGEEAAQPLHAIPRAILAAVVIGVVYFVFLTWVMSLGYGVANAGKWAQDPTALDTLARRYGGTGLAVVIDVAVVVDAFVAALAGIQLTSRTIFAMGRDGGMPRVFAWTHPRFKTPWVGIAAALLLTLVLVLWLPGHTFDPLTYFGFMATTASLGILFVYMLIALAGMVFFWRTRTGGITATVLLLDVLVPLGAIVICGLTIYWSVVPLPPYPISLAPVIAAVWFVIGLLLLVWLNVKSPQRVRSFGRLLAEGEAGASPDANLVIDRQS